MSGLLSSATNKKVQKQQIFFDKRCSVYNKVKNKPSCPRSRYLSNHKKFETTAREALETAVRKCSRIFFAVAYVCLKKGEASHYEACIIQALYVVTKQTNSSTQRRHSISCGSLSWKDENENECCEQLQFLSERGSAGEIVNIFGLWENETEKLCFPQFFLDLACLVLLNVIRDILC